MPFDGIVLSGAVWEINGLLEGGRIEKVFQTGRYEITLLCHSHGEKYRLLISANPENPRIHLTKSKKENPLVAPPFAMVLRKHIQSGKILSLTQEGYDRIVTLTIETHNEMGDIVNKKLIAEIMGKYSNIILTSDSGIIYDSVKRVDEDMSSVREVMPGRHYVFPPQQEKIKPEEFKELRTESIEENELPVSKLILKRIFGFSPMLCKAICQNAAVVQNKKFKDLSAEEIKALNKVILSCCNNISNRNFKPCIIADGKDFHCTYVVLKSAEQNNENIKKYSVFARVSPSDKLRIVKAWKSVGAVVTITGDDINDADALALADTGCAMSKFGTDVAKGAADMTLTDDNFATIVDAVEEGRGIYANIKKVVGFLLGTNIGEVICVFISMLIFQVSPLLSMQLLMINLVTDSLPAISLGMEAVESDVMKHKPKPKDEGIFAHGLGVRVVLQGLMFAILTLIGFKLGEFVTGTLEGGQTMAFMVLALSQIVQAYNMRSEHSLFKIGMFKNKNLNLAALTSTLLVALVLFTPVGIAFGMVTLPWHLYLIGLGLILVPLVVMVLRHFVKSLS